MSSADMPTQDPGTAVDDGLHEWVAAWELIAGAVVSVDQARQRILHRSNDED
jgi:hypothetical protein